MPDVNDPFILIVDDNANNLSVLSEILKSAGYKVRMAMNGEGTCLFSLTPQTKKMW